MALTLVKEDGTGLANANTYASRADGDAYHESVVGGTDWTGASTTVRDAALAMATRTLDAMFRFKGRRVTTTQALQWPRNDVIDAEAGDPSVLLSASAVPASLVGATCELARRLLVEDRTGDPDGTGLRSMTLAGSVRFVFDAARLKPVVTDYIAAMIGRLVLSAPGRSGTVPLSRV
jgi:hypothetical protein